MVNVQAQKQKTTVNIRIGDAVLRKAKKGRRKRKATKKVVQEPGPTRIITQYVQQFPPTTPITPITNVPVGVAKRLDVEQEKSDVVNMKDRKDEILRQLEKAMNAQSPSRPIKQEPTTPLPELEVDPTLVPSSSKQFPMPKEENKEFQPIPFTPLEPKPERRSRRRIPAPIDLTSDASSSDVDETEAFLKSSTVKQLHSYISSKLGLNPTSPYLNKENSVMVLLRAYKNGEITF